jgi:predicted RNA-binding Zn ribbon-like protein
LNVRNLAGGLTRGEHDPVGAALATLARDAVGLLIGPRTSRIKECEHSDCSLLVLDGCCGPGCFR